MLSLAGLSSNWEMDLELFYLLNANKQVNNRFITLWYVLFLGVIAVYKHNVKIDR